MDMWEYNGRKRKRSEEDKSKDDEKKIKLNGVLNDNNIHSIDNHIYFYSSVTKKSITKSMPLLIKILPYNYFCL